MRKRRTENLGIVWNADGSGSPLLLRGHTDTIGRAQFSADGRKVLTSSFDGTVRLWPLDGKPDPVIISGKDLSVPRALPNALLTPDGTRVVIATNQVATSLTNNGYVSTTDGTIVIWSADRKDNAIVGGQKWIASMTLSPDGKRIVTAGDDAALKVWRAAGNSEPVILQGRRSRPSDARFDPAGLRILSVGLDRMAVLQNADGTGQPQVWDMGVGVESVEFSGNGARAVMLGRDDRNVYLWTLGRKPTLQTLRGHRSAVHSARFSGDGNLLVTSSGDGSARVWRADATGEPIVLRMGDDGGVEWAEFSPDQTHVLTVTARGAALNLTARVWTVGWKDLVAQLRERTSECLSIGQRLRYLSEPAEVATARFTACEREFGRSAVTPAHN